MRDDRRRVLGLIGSGLAVGFAGCSAFSANDGGSPASTSVRQGDRTSTETIQSPDTSTTTSETTSSTEGDSDGNSDSESQDKTPEKIESAPDAYRSIPLPKNPSDHKYATMGSEDASVTARFYGAWKCPYTQHFVLDILPTLVEEYVEPGDVAIEFRAVAYEDGKGFHGPDEPRAARAGLVVWNEDPESFWRYFGTMFENQNSAPGWATTETLLRVAKKADVSNLSGITSQIESGKYQSQIEETMKQVHSIPISRVPRIVVGDTVTAPTVSTKRTKKQLDAALDSKKTTTTTTTDDSGTSEGGNSGTTTTSATTSTTTSSEDSGTTSTTTTEDSGTSTTTTTSGN